MSKTDAEGSKNNTRLQEISHIDKEKYSQQMGRSNQRGKGGKENCSAANKGGQQP